VRGELTPTELSLSITPASVFIGDSITASGRLTSNGNSLANRKLTLLLDNEPLVITTGFDGSYATSITIPYKYVSNMTLDTIYIPSGSDIGTYLGCASSPVVVDTSFYHTLLEVSVADTAHPGLPVTISGQVSSTDGTIGRKVRVLLDSTQLAEEITQGQFNIQITPPPQISTGKHSLTVVVNPQGRCSGASMVLPINISTLPVQVEIQKPPLVLIPKPIEVSGKFYHSRGPLQDARVRLTFKDSSTTVKTSADGSFTVALDVPLDLSLVGPQELGITVEPVELWYATFQIERRIFTINPANVGLMLVAFVSLGLLVSNRVRSRLSGRRDKMVVPEAGLREPLIVAPVPAPEPGYEFSGTRDRVVSAYLSGLGIVGKVTGILMAPHTTLREFLNAAALQLPTAIKPFTELTLIAENALYSAHELDESAAAKAEQLVAIIKEELYGGAA
jgi:hypothetical protein